MAEYVLKDTRGFKDTRHGVSVICMETDRARWLIKGAIHLNICRDYSSLCMLLHCKDCLSSAVWK